MAHNTEVGELLTSVREHFADINRDPDLNDDDKLRLKEFYLEELIAPKARALLVKHFPDEFKDLVLTKKPYRRGKVWIDPNGPALAFLRKNKKHHFVNIEAHQTIRPPTRGPFHFVAADAASLDLERTRSSLAVRLVATATIGLQAFHVGCSLVEIACRGIFGDGCRSHLCVHGEIHRVIRTAALLPEILDLFERGLQLLRIHRLDSFRHGSGSLSFLSLEIT